MTTTVTVTAVVGFLMFATGLGIVVGNELRGYPWDHFVLGVAVALMVAGAHLISRQAVRDMLTDVVHAARKLLPWKGPPATDEHQQPPGPGA